MKRILIFQNPGCGICKKEKANLASKGISFDECGINLMSNGLVIVMRLVKTTGNKVQFGINGT